MTDKEIQEAIQAVPYWRHTITFPNGMKTPGYVPERHLRRKATAIPSNLKGWSVLDIGAWDGYFSFLCEQRGAKKILAIDSLEHTTEHSPVKQVGCAGILTAMQILSSNVEFMVMDLYDTPKWMEREKFDLVICFGVLYHLRDPLLGLQHISNLTGKKLCLSTLCSRDGQSIMEFHRRDPDEALDYWWWKPSVRCTMEMLEAVGFKNITEVNAGMPSDRVLITADKEGK